MTMRTAIEQLRDPIQPAGQRDFIDLHQQRGADAVKCAIASAVAPAMGDVPPDTVDAPAGDSWPDPLPLPKLPGVEGFDLRLLPDKFAPWVADAAERARFAPDFPAASAMAALGSLVGRKIGIRLKAKDDWTEYANVWAALIGLPSSLKSPAMRDAMAPFKRLQFAADEAAAKAILAHNAAVEVAKIRNEGAKKSARAAYAENPAARLDLVLEAIPPAPPQRVYWTSDATVARLSEILVENPTGLLVERDELSGLLTSLEDEGNADARGFYLSGWSGKEGYRTDRIMRGKTAIDAFALSVVGGIQPGPLERYIRGAFSGVRADGLLQRFQLAVWPDAQDFNYVDRWPEKIAKDAAAELFKFADTFDPARMGQSDGFGSSPPFIRLDAGAQGLFVEWYTGFMTQRRSREANGEDCAAVSSHFGKYPGLLGKIALILHVADNPNASAVDTRTMLKALSWLEYLELHARRIYHAIDTPDADTARLLLARIKRAEVPAGFKPREIYRKGWHGLGDAKRVKGACRVLADYDYLRAIDAGDRHAGRPPDPMYYINPKVFA
jgi:putative DNA primase/helicase